MLLAGIAAVAHNRTQLNDLIFHNRVMLPLSSPGHAEMTLAVAELQGGNNVKRHLRTASGPSWGRS